jgi:hypothetical protein
MIPEDMEPEEDMGPEDMEPEDVEPEDMEPIRPRQHPRASNAFNALPWAAEKAAFFGVHSCKPSHQADLSRRFWQRIHANGRITAGLAASSET